jgi:hypothetical protein
LAAFFEDSENDNGNDNDEEDDDTDDDINPNWIFEVGMFAFAFMDVFLLWEDGQMPYWLQQLKLQTGGLQLGLLI